MSEKIGWEKSPNESPGKIHPIAERQLAQRQEIAKDWPTYWDSFDRDTYLRCSKCDLAIFQIMKGGKVYQMTQDERQTMKIAHIANHHPEAFSGIE